MQKIITQEEQERRDKRRNQIISIILLLLMLGSVAGFAFVYETGNNNAAAGQAGAVTNDGSRWITNFNGQTLSFSESPESINATSITLLSTINQFAGQPLYIDTNNSAMYAEIVSSLGLYSQRYQYACYSNCENSTFPKKTCADNLIVISPSNINKVYQNQSCIFIQGDMRAVDAFLYREFGIA